MTKDELIEKYRDINVDHDWWHHVYENFDEYMKERGIAVASSNRSGTNNRLSDLKIYFSGFYSQGDGACFEGYVDDWGKFFEHYKESFNTPDLQYPMHIKEMLHASWNTSGNYCHSNTLRFDVEAPDISDEWETDEDGNPVNIQEAVMSVALSNFNFLEFEETIASIIRGECDDLYRDLMDEHEHLTSDESVWETIVANELDKESEEEDEPVQEEGTY